MSKCKYFMYKYEKYTMITTSYMNDTYIFNHLVFVRSLWRDGFFMLGGCGAVTPEGVTPFQKQAYGEMLDL